jgi:hypothetical protein
MALHGMIIQLPNGSLALQCASTHLLEPKETRHTWELKTWHFMGYGSKDKEDAIGKAATIVDGRVSAYLGNGTYLRSDLPQLGATPATTVETVDVPRPKVRKGIETRWHNSRWERYTARGGWIPA